jgi:predicted nuclease with TOPRIM domain
MTEVDILRMKRRNLQVEAKRLEEKLYMLKEEMRKMDSRINVLITENSSNFSVLSSILK